MVAIAKESDRIIYKTKVYSMIPGNHIKYLDYSVIQKSYLVLLLLVAMKYN